MKALKNVAISKFTIGEALQFMTTMSDVYNNFELKATILDARFKELQDEVQTLKAPFMENRRITLTEKLKPLDVKRLNILRGIKKFLAAEIDRDHPERAPHAAALSESFSQFCDGISRFSLQHKTVLIDKLLNALNTEAPLIKAIEILNIQDWVNELTVQNEAFYSNYFDKAKSKSQRIQANIMKERIKAIYDKLVMDINSLVWIAEDKEKYDPLVKELNNIIEANYTPVKNRTAKKKKMPVYPTLPVAYVVQ